MNRSADPRVTVCIPNRNGGEYLGETIRSVLNQSFTDFRVIVADNASSDHSRDVCESFSDPRLEFIANDDLLPVSANWNRALQCSTSELTALLHSDDTWHTDFLATMVARLDECSTASAVICSSDLIDEHGRPMTRGDRPVWVQPARTGTLDEYAYQELLLGMYVRPCAWLARTSLFSEVQFDERFNRAPDWDFWLRAAALEDDIVFEPAVLCDYRLHATNDTFTESCLTDIRNDERVLISEAIDRREVPPRVARRARQRVDMRAVIRIIQVVMLRDVRLAGRLTRGFVRQRGVYGLISGAVQLICLPEARIAAMRSLRSLIPKPRS